MKKFALLIFFLLLTINQYAQDPEQTLRPQDQEKQITGNAPEFKLENVDGEYVSLKEELGKGPVLLSFWATWCKPCIEEMTKYKDLYEQYKDKGLKIFGISTDDERTVAKVKPFVKSKKYPFTILLDTNSDVARKYYAQNIPYSVLIDKNGKITYTHLGYMKGDELKMQNKIEELVNNK